MEQSLKLTYQRIFSHQKAQEIALKPLFSKQQSSVTESPVPCELMISLS